MLIKNEKNLGISKSLNLIISKIDTKYIARMDADDFSYKERFQNQIEFLETNEKIDILGTNVDYFDLNGDFLSASNLPLSMDR